MASAFYRFTDPLIGESITGFARENIKRVIADLEKDGLEVIYSDTDSVFFKSPEPTLEGAVATGKKIAERYSKGGLQLEFEKVMNPFFPGAKKRYVGKILWPREEIIYRGFEVRRTDSFDWQSKSLEDVFEQVLNENIDGALKTARDRVTQVAKGDVPTSMLVISRSVQDEGDYKFADRMTNVQVRRELEKRGIDIQPGMKVSWVVTSGKGKQEVAPYTGPDSEKDIRPDYEYYARRTAMTLARITEVFGWGVEDLLKGSRTKSLLEGFGPSKGSSEDEEGDEPDAAREAKEEPAKKAPTTTGKPKPVIDKKAKALEDYF
jgi:DNA polymerase I